MIKRLRIKFVCINMVIVTVMLCVIFGVTLNLTRRNMENESLDMMQQMFAPDKHDEEKDKKSEKPSDEKDVKPEKPAEENGKPEDEPKKEAQLATFTLRYDSTGTLVATGNDSYDLTDTAYLQAVLDAAIATEKENGDLVDYALRFVCVNDSDGNRYIFTDISSEQTTMHNLIRDCLIIGGISFVAFLLISIWLSLWAIKPVEKAWAQQRQFVADASHELKTPLTVITTNAELLQEPEITTENRRKSAQSVLITAKQMRVLTEELLTLARADDAHAQLQELNFSELLEDALLPFEAVFFEKNLSLRTEIAENLCVKGNETQLRQIADILLDNVQKYAKPGEVVLTLKKQGHGTCLLSVSNFTEPVAKEDLQHIFERFYRIDKVRTSSGSYGLGLSIAESIITRHRGKIYADYQDGIITFNVKLPMA